MRTIIFAIALAVGVISAGPSRAAYVSIDIFSAPTATITIPDFGGYPFSGPYYVSGPCYCQPGYVTGFFSVQPGDVVDFGKLTIYSAELTTPLLAVQFGNFPLVINYLIDRPLEYMVNPTSVVDDLAEAPPVTYDLTAYVIPAYTQYIQLAWLGPYDYAPPVPELSTWVMLLIGFAGIAAASRRLTRSAAAECTEAIVGLIRLDQTQVVSEH